MKKSRPMPKRISTATGGAIHPLRSRQTHQRNSDGNMLCESQPNSREPDENVEEVVSLGLFERAEGVEGSGESACVRTVVVSDAAKQ